MTTRALVTGAAGFIGSNLFLRLRELGWDVQGVDNMSSGHEELLPSNSDVLFCSCDHPMVIEAIQSQEFDVVFHIAAMPRVSFSIEQPLLTNRNNVSHTLRLMNACTKNIKRFVFASSSSVYGNAVQLPTPETYPKDPISPYALQKSIIEDYLKLWYTLYGMDSVSLRFFNVFGPHQIGGSPYATALAAWLSAIHRDQCVRSDGDATQTRDLCYVDIVVDACVKSAPYSGNLAAQRFNVATGESVSNAQVLSYLAGRFSNVRIENAPERPGDVKHTLADITAARSVLDYQPIVKTWEGIERTCQWYESNLDFICALENKKHVLMHCEDIGF